MGEYAYKALTYDRRKVKGTVAAESKVSAAQMIQQKGLYIICLKERKVIFPWKLHMFHPVKIRETAIFCRQLATMFESGIPLMDGLSTLQKQTRNNRFALVLQEIMEDVEKGKTFYQAVMKHPKIFSQFFMNMIEAGEGAGILDQTLTRLARYFEKEYDLREKIKSAATYPLILVSVVIGMILFMLLVVLPNFVSIFASVNAQLPLSTRILLGAGALFRQYFLYFFSGLMFFVWLIYRLVHSPEGRLLAAEIALKTPGICGLTLRVVTARFARMLGTLLSNGTSILVALDTVAAIVENELLSRQLSEVKGYVEGGGSLADILQKQALFPPMLVQMVAIGEKTGRIDELLDKAADFYEKEVDRTVERFSSLLEPVLIIIMGGVVGFIVFSVMMPLFEMMNML